MKGEQEPTIHPAHAHQYLQGPALPRSVRWRMQLGLLKYPESEIGWTTEDLHAYNEQVLKQQRAAYRGLCDHYELDLVEDENGFVKQADQQEEVLSEDEEDVDPLTMMVMDIEKKEKRRQELELKYRKEKALRKRGVAVDKVINDDSDGDRFDTYSSTLTLGVIEKDLNRLQPDHHTSHHSRKNYQFPGTEISFDDSKQERTQVLTEILHVYAREHSHIGYRQGMHEIASYLLMVLEMDMFDQESSLEQQPSGGLLDTEFLASDAYHMLKCIMGSLQRAYDVKQHATDASPMEEMAKSILSKVKDTACDKQLYDHVMRMNCPPELYCTRWVRLMFSREVEGWRNVLLLWDIILDLVSMDGTISSMNPSKYTRPGVSPPLRLGEFPLMQVLEAAAASMILLQRSQLLNAEDPNESIHTLMNVPPLKNILPLTATLLSMMRRLQLNSSKEEQIEVRRSSYTTTSILQSAQNAIRDISLGSSSPGAFHRSLKAETVSVLSKPEIPVVPSLEDGSWRGSIRKIAFPKGDHLRAATSVRTASPPRTVAKPFLAEADDVLSPSEMATTLNQGVSTIRNYLTALETARKGAAIVVPQAIWAALEEVDKVRTDLLADKPNMKKGLSGRMV